MSKTQLGLFSVAALMGIGNGVGLATILPVYLTQLGADASFIGLFYSLLFLALGASGLLAGWMVDRFGNHRKLAIISTWLAVLTSIPIVYGRSLPVFAAGMISTWFLAGFFLAILYILVGLMAHEKERGTAFGVLALASGIGTIISGFLYGQIADRFGFPVLFTLVLGIAVLWGIGSFFFPQPEHRGQTAKKSVNQPAQPPDGKQPQPGGLLGLGVPFMLLFFASLSAWMLINGGKLAISMAMIHYEFNTSQISTSNAIGGLISLPVPLLLGWVSDRFGRKHLLLALNFLGLAALLVLTWQHSLAAFWAASALFSLYSTIGVINQALTTDLIPRRSIGIGMSMIGATSSLSGILSSILVGLSVGWFGISGTFFAGMPFAVAGFILLLFLREEIPATVEPIQDFS
jgi:MFS family permease